MSSARTSWRMALLKLNGECVRARKRLGMTQAETAERLSVSRRNFQRWEDGRAEPSASELFRWADLLGIEISSTDHGHCAKSVASQEAA